MKTTSISPEGQAALDNIMSRTSRRKFDTDRMVSDEYIEVILHAAMAAPTGVNRQPWHFIVVESRNKLDQLAEGLPYCQAARQAPVAIVVCGDSRRFLDEDDSTLWVQDLSAASENILLAANALSLGAVWTALYPHADREDIVRRILDIRPELTPFNVIPLGYTTDTHNPMDKWHPERVDYIKE